jgi:hypothetical protein
MLEGAHARPNRVNPSETDYLDRAFVEGLPVPVAPRVLVVEDNLEMANLSGGPSRAGSP